MTTHVVDEAFESLAEARRRWPNFGQMNLTQRHEKLADVLADIRAGRHKIPTPSCTCCR